MLPQLVTSRELSEDGALLDVLVEINPLDKLCTQRVHVNAKPVKVIYDAQTINKVMDVFQVPSETQLDQ